VYLSAQVENNDVNIVELHCCFVATLRILFSCYSILNGLARLNL